MESESPTGGEFISLVNIIVNNFQPELKKLDSKNKLLKYRINDIGGGISYPPEFGREYKGLQLNQAIESHYLKLEREIKRLRLQATPA